MSLELTWFVISNSCGYDALNKLMNIDGDAEEVCNFAHIV